jgi:hypothetical protein
VLTKNDSADNTIHLKVPDGYMAFSKPQGDDLVMTLQQMNADGTPGETAVVRLKGVLAPHNQTRIDIESGSVTSASVIDMGGVNIGFNIVSLKKGKADDVIIAPGNALDSMKLKMDDLGHPTIGPAQADTINKKMTSKDKDGTQNSWISSESNKDGKPLTTVKSVVNPDGSISLELKGKVESGVDLKTPEGYMDGISQQGKDEIIVTLFKRNPDGTIAERMVLRVKQSGGKPSSVTVNGSGIPTAAMAVKLIGQGKKDSGGVFVGSSYSSDKSEAGKNEVILNYPAAPTPNKAPAAK